MVSHLILFSPQRVENFKTEDSDKASLEERKLTYVHLADGTEPRTPSSVSFLYF